MWTFDRFEPGALIGETALSLDADTLSRWAQLYPGASAGRASPDLLTAMMMRGYMEVISPRPPGNVHAGQKLRWTGSLPPSGSAIRARYSCLAKEIRKDRRRVTIGAQLTSDDGRILLEGELLMMWAA